MQKSRENDDCKFFIDFMFLEHCNNIRTEIENFNKSQKNDVVVNNKNVVVKAELQNPNARQKLILQMIKENPKITANSIALQLDKNIRTIQRDLATLSKQKKIIHTGADKNGEWVVN